MNYTDFIMGAVTVVFVISYTIFRTIMNRRIEDDRRRDEDERRRQEDERRRDEDQRRRYEEENRRKEEEYRRRDDEEHRRRERITIDEDRASLSIKRHLFCASQ